MTHAERLRCQTTHDDNARQMRGRAVSFIAIPFVSLIALTGCATITDGTGQTIIFNLNPKEALCRTSRGDAELGTFSGTSSTLSVSKGARDIVVTCTAQGFVDKVLHIESSTQAAGVIGGVFLGLGIVDMMTGAMWKYPEEVSIDMEPENAPAAADHAESPETAEPTSPTPPDNDSKSHAKGYEAAP